jgi:5-methyltetrahydrofolate--homocysteine methyltransferase
MSDWLKALSDAVIEGDMEAATNAIHQALAGGVGADALLDKGLLPGMEIVGQRFRCGESFIPEVLLSARTMQTGMDVLRPLLSEKAAAGIGTVIIGTVEGDIHNIGKNLVAMMMEGAGFKVIDLGIDVKPQSFVDAAHRHKPDLVAMSALLTTTMPKMAATVDALKEAGLRDCVKIMAGGAPVTEEFVRKIGADGYGANAAVAVHKAKALLGR